MSKIKEALDALNKATKGKWAVNENRAMVDDADGFPICALAWPHAIRSEDETKANAALAAAAPDMAALLIRCWPWLLQYKKNLNQIGGTCEELDAILKELG